VAQALQLGGQAGHEREALVEELAGEHGVGLLEGVAVVR
jgi:hypothetical protein